MKRLADVKKNGEILTQMDQQNQLGEKSDSTPDEVAAAFIDRWSGITASELATAQSFVVELCALLSVEPPHPTPEEEYMFERPVTFYHGDGSTSRGRIRSR